MRIISVTIAALATIAIVASASAQMSSSTRSEMDSMRKSNPTSFNACHDLAVKRGYSTNDQEQEGRSLMNFISGCMVGRTR